jgi:hypothetical protein
MTQDYLNKRLANQGSADSYSDYRRERYSDGQLLEQIKAHQDQIVAHLLSATLKKNSEDSGWHLDEARAHYYLNRIYYDIRLLKDIAWRELVLRNNWIEVTEHADYCRLV